MLIGLVGISEPLHAFQNRQSDPRIPIMIVDPIGALSEKQEETILTKSRIYAPIPFGEVPEEQLTMQADHSFPYEILAKTRVITFEESKGSIIARIEDHFRIKMYSSDAREQIEAALITIPVLRGQESEQVDQIRGMTHQPGGEWVELSQQDIRRTQYSNQIDLIEFLMPEVKPGSVLEYRYRTTRYGIEELPDFFFSERVPVRYASLHMVHQSYLRYDEQLQDSKEHVGFVPERIDTSSARRLFSERRPEPVYIAHWIAYQVPAEEISFTSEPASGSRTGIRFLIGEFGLPRQTLENSWDVVAARLRRASDPFELVTKAERFLAVGDSISQQLGKSSVELEGSDLEKEILEQSYQWIQNHTIFNQTYSIFPDSISLEQMKPDHAMGQASRQLALMAVLRGAGLDARPLYYSDGVFGVMDTLFPSIHQLQRMALLVQLSDGQRIIADATNENARPGFILPEALGQSALSLTDSDGFAFVSLQGEMNRYSSHFQLNAELLANGDLEAEITATLEGYPALQAHRERSGELSAEQWIRALFLDRYQEVRLSKVSLEDDFLTSGIVRFVANVEISDFAVEFQDALDFSPMIVGYLDQNPFEAEQRRTAVELDAPEELSVQIALRFPNGFKSESFMEDQVIELAGARYLQEFSYNNRELTYAFFLTREETRFAVSDYPLLRSMYGSWVEWSGSRWRLMKSN